jgi:hypothetical protein
LADVPVSEVRAVAEGLWEEEAEMIWFLIAFILGFVLGSLAKHIELQAAYIKRLERVANLAELMEKHAVAVMQSRRKNLN